VLALLLGFSFTLVSIIALIKQRFFACHSTRDFEAVETQIQKLLEQEEFKGLLKNHEIEFRKIKFKSKDLAECGGFYRTSAYNWQLGLATIILIGIVFLLFVEFAMFLKPFI
jgi:hypothetical protein